MTRAKDISKITTAPAMGGLTYPTSDGSNGQFVKTNGSGTLSFGTATGTTINNNADNRIITGSGTANTLEGESTLTYDGTNLDLGDSKKLRFGASQDLQIYHDGSNSYISDAGTGPLIIEGSQIAIKKIGVDETMALFTPDADVALYHNNVKKLSTEGSGIQILGATNDVARIAFGDSDDVDIGFISYNNGDNHMQFATSTAERMRIDTNGNIMFGSSSQLNAGKISVLFNGQSQNGLIMKNTHSGGNHVEFINSSGNAVGTINQNSGSSVAYNTSSDYRLKENVITNWDATSRLKQLKPSRFNFITDADTTVDGFIAHEVSSIVPEAITGTKNATETYTDDDGKEQTRPIYQGIDQSKLVPLLVKTIQELEARITALESA